MINFIVGKMGSGKTKHLIEMVNNAVVEENGSIICVERGTKLTYDISHKARLIDVSAYPVSGYESFIGFLSGLYAQNYDISHIFIDSLYKVVGSSERSELLRFLSVIEGFTKKYNVRFTITVSAEHDDLPQEVLAYI